MTELETWQEGKERLWRFQILLLASVAYWRTFGWDAALIIVAVVYSISVLISIYMQAHEDAKKD
jgi:hypothetical protein